MGKGAQTRAAILNAGMEVAATQGLEALAIGPLAERVGLSKSGLYAHFQSKQGLQLALLERARADFVSHVLAPAVKQARGEPRIRALLDHWLAWSSPETREGGCVFIQAAAEYDDRPGAVRSLLVRIQQDWIDDLLLAASMAKEEGHFRPDLDLDQFAYELHAVILAHHFHTRLMRDPDVGERTRQAFARLLEDARGKLR